jgi:uncharacterized membrane protein YkvA (DUF1232 family)
MTLSGNTLDRGRVKRLSMKWITIVRTFHRYWKMAHDPRTPPAVRYLIYFGVLYTLSPVDLLPDWVPGLGLLDEAAILPGVIAVAMLLIPQAVKEGQDLKEHKEIEASQDRAIEVRQEEAIKKEA